MSTRCLVPGALLAESEIRLPETAVRHLHNVLRMSVGQNLTLVDGRGRALTVSISAISRREVVCNAGGSVRTLPQPDPEIILFQAVAKGTRMDWLVEKAAELGTTRLLPVITRRSVARLKPGTRVERWERIADSALEQSQGYWRMQVEPVLSWSQALEQLARIPLRLAGALTTDSRPLVENLKSTPPPAVAWIVGPEGDFDDAEMQDLRTAGARMCSLGPQVLRVETAAIYGLSVLHSHWRCRG